MEKKQVKFSHLKIDNFKGIKLLEIDFSDETTISGMNATGKSTIFDALFWCLFGKNSQNAKDFNIKNTVFTDLNRSDHVVELTMMVSGEEIKAMRVYREKWVKRRGSEESEFSGHETLFFWNDVPLSAGEYQAKVSEVTQEELFKQITNPLYFNVNMKWQERRELLVAMAKDVTDAKVINGTESFRMLFASIEGKKSLEEYRKELAYERSGLKKQLADIPSRIDELIKSNPATQDWNSISGEITKKQAAIRGIDKEIEDITFFFDKEMAEIKVKQQESIAASRKMGDIVNDLTKKSYAEASEANKSINEAKYFLGEIRAELKSHHNRAKEYKEKYEALETQVANLRQMFILENARQFVFDRDTCVCPTCKRAFESATIEEKETELFNNFREEQTKTKEQIRSNGKTKANSLAEYKMLYDLEVSAIANFTEREQAFIWAETAVPASPKQPDLTKNVQYNALKEVSERIIEVKKIDVSEQKDMKLALAEGINTLKDLLAGKAQIEKNAIRIEELKADEKKYSKALAELERREFTIEEFQKAKITAIESSINGKFKLVKFKLFDLQINGGESPCCEATVLGVPFSDLNHAAQIAAGIDIINALSDTYGISAPIVLDNAESCNSYPQTNSQLIKLYVTSDPQLVITNS